MGSTNTEQFLPSRGLAIASAFAKGWGDYKKRLQEQEMEKQAQRSELLKVILPRYMEQEASRAEWERERPLEHAKFQLEQQKVTQTGQLGFAGLQVEIAGLQNAWNISQSESASATERANAKNLIDVQLKGLDVKIEEYRQQAANLRQSMQSGTAVDVAEIGAAGRKEVAAAEIAGRKEVSTAEILGRKDITAAQVQSHEDIATWKNETDKWIAKLKQESEAKFPQALREQVKMYQVDAALAAQIWTAANVDPKYVPAANLLTQIVVDSKTSINAALAETGGAQMPTSALPELALEKTGWGFWKGEKTVPVVPGITPSPGARPGEAATGLEVQGQPPAMQLPELRTSGDEFDEFVNRGVAAGWTSVKDTEYPKLRKVGIDPEALDRALKERHARK